MLQGDVEFGVQDQQHGSNRHPTGEAVVLVEPIGKPGVVEEIGEGRCHRTVQIQHIRDGPLSEAEDEKVNVADYDIGRVSGCVEWREANFRSPVQTARHCGRPGVLALVMHSWSAEFDNTCMAICALLPDVALDTYCLHCLTFVVFAPGEVITSTQVAAACRSATPGEG